jgi:hypothetical protein
MTDRGRFCIGERFSVQQFERTEFVPDNTKHVEKRFSQLGSPTYVIWCMLCSPAKEQIYAPDFTLSACYFKFTLRKTYLLNHFWDVIG